MAGQTKDAGAGPQRKAATTTGGRRRKAPSGPRDTSKARESHAAILQRARERAMADILTALRGGATRRAAAAAGRVSHEALYSWMREPDAYSVTIPEVRDPASGAVVRPAEVLTFTDAVERAEQEAVLFYANTVRRAGIEAERTYHYDKDGNLLREVVKYDWRAAAWWLEHHPSTKADWRAVQRTEVTGPEGQPVQIGGTVAFRPDDAWLAQYREALGALPPEVAGPMIDGPRPMKNVTPEAPGSEDEGEVV